MRLSGTLQGRIIPLEEFPNWDRKIAAFPQKTIFHESVWLRFLEKDQAGRAMVLQLTTPAGEERVLWPGLVVRKGPVRIFGSPLRGWGTVVMGPLYRDEEAVPLLKAAESALKAGGIHHWEFVSESLPTGPAPERGYRLESSDTHRIPLDPDEEKMWARLQVRCRTSTRKAVKSGLVARISEGPAFLENLYRNVLGVFARQGTTPSYDLPRLQRVWESLYPSGRAFGIEVLAGEEMAAAGLFVGDERQAYTWAEASDARFNALGPNNLCYWEAMRHFSGRGGLYLHSPGAAVGGIGKFKASFNPDILQYPFWILDRSRVLRWGRRLYKGVVAWRARRRFEASVKGHGGADGKGEAGE